MSFVSLHLLCICLSSPGRPDRFRRTSRPPERCKFASGPLPSGDGRFASATLLTFGHAVQLSRSPVLPHTVGASVRRASEPAAPTVGQTLGQSGTCGSGGTRKVPAPLVWVSTRTDARVDKGWYTIARRCQNTVGTAQLTHDGHSDTSSSRSPASSRSAHGPNACHVRV